MAPLREEESEDRSIVLERIAHAIFAKPVRAEENKQDVGEGGLEVTEHGPDAAKATTEALQRPQVRRTAPTYLLVGSG